mgnify:CR=1 FL=1
MKIHLEKKGAYEEDHLMDGGGDHRSLCIYMGIPEYCGVLPCFAKPMGILSAIPAADCLTGSIGPYIHEMAEAGNGAAHRRGGILAWFLSLDAFRMAGPLVAIPFFILGILYFFGRPEPRKWACRFAWGLP